MSKQFLGVLAAIVLIFAGILIFSGGKSSAPSKASKTGALTQHIQGKGTTGVTLVEYGDYQCPYCGIYYPILKQVQAQYGDKIRFQFRNFPLVGLHRNAFAAARAAEAADMQNKFWEMHDLLYENQDQWKDANSPVTFFKQYAAQLKLNTAQFEKDFASSTVNDLINADTAEGTKLKVTGTPGFILDGKLVQIGQSVPAFQQAIDAEIAKKIPETKTSVPAGQ